MKTGNAGTLCSVILLGFVLAGMASLEIAHATIYYVATTGNDSQACSTATNSTTPRKTITSGMQCLAPGDTLEIKGGTYNEAVFNNGGSAFPDGTGPNNRTTIRGAAGEIVIWTRGGGSYLFSMKNAGSYTRFENIRFDASMVTIDAWKHYRQDSGTTVGLEFVNNHIYNAPDNGMYNGINTSGWLIEGNTVYNSGRLSDPINDPKGNNMYLEGNNHIVRGNRVYYTVNPPGGNYGGIRVGNNLADGQGANNNIIENNYVSGGQSGIIFGTGDNNIVRNNIVANLDPSASWHTGIHLWAQGTWSQNGNKIHNNTVFNAPKCIRASTDLVLTNSEAKNNILFNCSNIAIDDPSGILLSSNNLTTDPLFVSAASEDFHLQAGSAAIDAGTTLSDVQTDHEGVSRPQGSAYDIGAFESDLAINSPPAPPSGLAASVSGTTITLTWNPNVEQDLEGYTVYMGTSPGTYGTPISVGNVLTYHATGLQTNTTYYFAITAIDSASNESSLSNEVSATVSTYTFPAPLISPAPSSTLTSTTVTFTGGHTSQDLEHLLRIGTTLGGSQILNQSLGTGHSYTVSNLPTTGTIYVWYWSRNSSGWFVSQHTYTMNVGGQ